MFSSVVLLQLSQHRGITHAGFANFPDKNIFVVFRWLALFCSV